MRRTFGPLDASGRIPGFQQTRIAGFLISAHGAGARLLAGALGNPLLTPVFGAREVELHMQFCREMEFVSLLTRATTWQLDPMLAWYLWQWELAWFPRPVEGLSGPAQSSMIDAAGFGYALHTAVRPAVLLPPDLSGSDPFAAALRRIEAEGSRTVQAQLRFLKSPELVSVRNAISAAVDRRQQQMRQLWTALLSSMGVCPES